MNRKMNQFKRIFLTGMPGCGKTVVGRYLAEIMLLPFIDLDAVISKNAGMDINRIFAELGETQFRRMEAHWLREVSSHESEFVLATGGGAPCFHGNIEFMNSVGVTVFLDVHLDELCLRLMRRGTSKRPLLRHLSEEKLRSELHEKFEQRRPYYTQSKIRVLHPDNVSPVQRARDIKQELWRLKEESQA